MHHGVGVTSKASAQEREREKIEERKRSLARPLFDCLRNKICEQRNEGEMRSRRVLTSSRPSSAFATSLSRKCSPFTLGRHSCQWTVLSARDERLVERVARRECTANILIGCESTPLQSRESVINLSEVAGAKYQAANLSAQYRHVATCRFTGLRGFHLFRSGTKKRIRRYRNRSESEINRAKA